MWLAPASKTQQAKAEVEQSSGLPGFPVLAFLVRKVFVPTFVPKMAAGGSPEVTFVSVDWTTSPRTSSCPCLLCDREKSLKWNGKDPLSAAVRIPYN